MDLLVQFFVFNAIKAAGLACIVVLVSKIPKLCNQANMQHSLWCLVLMAMITPSVVGLPVISLPNRMPIGTGQEFSSERVVHSVAPEVRVDAEPSFKANVPDHRNPDSSLDWFMAGALAVSFAGTVGMLLIAASRVRKVRNTLRLASFDDEKLLAMAAQAAKQLGISRQINVAVVQSNTSPFVYIDRGSVNIVMPRSLGSSLSHERLRCIMLHELSHYWRRDHWANQFAFIVLAVCWWNPISWVAVRRMRALQEHCCDAMAIAKSHVDRREYAECLYQITSFIESKNACMPASACELFGPTAVEERFKMIANSKVGFATTKNSLVLVALFSVFLPCSIAFSQADSKAVPKNQDQQAKDAAESKQWHETMEKFNSFVKEGDWQKAEKLANETASKFGHEDALVQNMLLTSINGVRKSQGLAPILVEKLVVDPKSGETPIVVLYSLKETLPANAADKDRFVEILTQCILASIASDGSDKPGVKVYFDNENLGLIVLAPRPQQNLVAAILSRIGQKPKP